MKKMTETFALNKLRDMRVKIAGKVISNWRDQGIRTQGRIEQ